MVEWKGVLAFSAVCLLLGSASPPTGAPAEAFPSTSSLNVAQLVARTGFRHANAVGMAAPLEPPPPPPTPREALAYGVLVVVSKASQQAFVFRRGQLWDSTSVSTGRRGFETPDGIFPILQKKVHHRSNLYNDAPMPYMQRLTWDGVALHAGQVPGYPASHGCIRLPREFAKNLYGITRFNSTIVIVTDDPVEDEGAALQLV